MGRAQTDPDDDIDNAICEVLRRYHLTPEVERHLLLDLHRLVVEHGGKVQAKKLYGIVEKELRALKLT